MFVWFHKTFPKNTFVSNDFASSKKKKKEKEKEYYLHQYDWVEFSKG